MRCHSKIATTVCALACLATAAVGQVSSAPTRGDVVIKNAIVMTATHGNIKNGSIYIKDGKIAAVETFLRGQR